VHLLVTASERTKFRADAFEVVDGGGGFAIADGIDPKDPVVFGQAKHDVLLAERIAIPIVAKTDDVVTLNHTCR
jgi:hypothetical protein